MCMVSPLAVSFGVKFCNINQLRNDHASTLNIVNNSGIVTLHGDTNFFPRVNRTTIMFARSSLIHSTFPVPNLTFGTVIESTPIINFLNDSPPIPRND